MVLKLFHFGSNKKTEPPFQATRQSIPPPRSAVLSSHFVLVSWDDPEALFGPRDVPISRPVYPYLKGLLSDLKLMGKVYLRNEDFSRENL